VAHGSRRFCETAGTKAGEIAAAAEARTKKGRVILIVLYTVPRTPQNFTFPGQYYDHESGLHYNYHRYYNPATGRYLTPDLIGLKGGLNLFLYAGANPINAIDPKGLKKIYGNWCGPDWTGGYDKSWDQLTDEEKQSVASPEDELDSCCETHDKCYVKCRENFPCLEDDRKMCFRQCDLQLNMCPGTMNVRGPRSYLIKKYMQDTNPGAGDNSTRCCEK